MFEHISIPEESKEKFFKYYPIKELPEIDPFFAYRKFNNNESTIMDFFATLVKKYKKYIDKFQNENLEYPYPLIFVLEDSQNIDEISTDFISILNRKIDNNLCIICTYQDQMTQLTSRDPDRFIKSLEIFEDKVFYMENITDLGENQEMIKTYLEGRLAIDKIDTELLEIILPKSFKGVPFFTLEIVDSLIESNRYVQHPGQELLTTSELLDMHNDRDWSNFVIPMKMEKLVGYFIDDLDFREIILLKMAATIGNLFDLDKLYKLNPFNFFTLDDMYSILMRMESAGIIEFLHDPKPKRLVCKFAIPFYRDLLYQRMLIEQRNDIHMNVARLMQFSKFSYMPAQVEVELLKYHLKKTEKSIINYMEEEDNEQVSSNKEIKFSTTNNQKIVLVKEVCQKLKAIDLKFDEEDMENHPGLIYQGMLGKKSDSNITWERRHIVMTNKRFFYYYTDKDYRENKEPLGYFEIKHLYKLEILPDYAIGNKKNIFSITVSQWNKKDITQKGRTFFLSTETKEKLNDWVTQINFLRVKATYDEFAATYGLINLPLPHEVPEKNAKKIKSKLNNNLLSTVFTGKTSAGFYNAMARRSIMNHAVKHLDNDGKKNAIRGGNRRASFMPKNLTEKILEDMDNQNKVKKSKENLVTSFALAFICILSYVQDIIFNVENVGMREDKTISVSKGLLEILYKFYNFSKEPSSPSISLLTPQPTNSSNNLPALTENTPDVKTKNDDKESVNSSSSSMSFKSINTPSKKPKSTTKVIEAIKEEEYLESQQSLNNDKAERLKEYNRKIEEINVKEENDNPGKGKVDTAKEIKDKENEEKVKEKEIFVNLDFKVKKDETSANANNNLPQNNNNVINNSNNSFSNNKAINNSFHNKSKDQINQPMVNTNPNNVSLNNAMNNTLNPLNNQAGVNSSFQAKNKEPQSNPPTVEAKTNISVHHNNILIELENKNNNEEVALKSKSGISNHPQENLNQTNPNVNNSLRVDNADRPVENFNKPVVLPESRLEENSMNKPTQNIADQYLTFSDAKPINNLNTSPVIENKQNNTVFNNNIPIPKPHVNTNVIYNFSTKSQSLNNFLLSNNNNSPNEIGKVNPFNEPPSSLKSNKFKSETNLLIQSPISNRKQKDDRPSTPISAKFKNFDLVNEDFEDLFKNEGHFSPDGANRSIKSAKKKKNYIIDNAKYHDLKTTENFNFYSSNIFSKLYDKK